MMTPHIIWFACLYIAWGVLLVVTGLLQQDRPAKLACLLGAAGFALFGANLFVRNEALHWTVRIIALVVLIKAAVLIFRARSRQEGAA